MKEVYAYVDEVGQRFADLLKESTPSAELSSFLQQSGHLDKCHQYQSAWESAGLSFGKACMVYMLSFCWPWTETVRHTTGGFVEPWKWVIDYCTTEGNVKKALDALPRVVHRLDDDNHSFKISIDGSIKYTAEREHLGPNERGYWILSDTNGNRLDRDKYSNDLIDRIESNRYDNKETVGDEIDIKVTDLIDNGYKPMINHDSTAGYVSLQKKVRDDYGVRYFIEARVTSMAKYKNCPKKSIFEFVVQFQNPDDLPTFTASFGIGLRQTAQSVTDTETAIDVLWKKLGSNYYERN